MRPTSAAKDPSTARRRPSRAPHSRRPAAQRRGRRSRLAAGAAAFLVVAAFGCSDPDGAGGADQDAPGGPPTADATVTLSPTTSPRSPTVSPATATPGTPEEGPASTATPAASASEPVQVTEVVTGLDRPWGLAFTPDGRVFVTEQDSGRVLELSESDGGRADATEVLRIEVDPQGEGGLLGLAASPTWEDDGLLYAYHSTTDDNRVVRFEPGGTPEPILTGVPHGRIHNGGRLAFSPDGMLHIGTGDAGNASLAQDRDSLAGKTLRIAPDGSIPDDNPFGTAVWSLGHRNVQGLAWDAGGQLYASEFGPDADDEINRIEGGGNHGWPVVTGTADDERFVDPVHVRQPPEASWSGVALSADPAVPQWAGDLLVASLRGERLWRLQLGPEEDGAEAASVVDAEGLLVDEYGRLRTAAYAPDGALWVVTSNTDIYGSPQEGDDRILRLSPEGS